MAQKNASPTKAQVEVMKRNGLNPLVWTVKQDLPNSLIVLHRITEDFKVIDK